MKEKQTMSVRKENLNEKLALGWVVSPVQTENPIGLIALEMEFQDIDRSWRKKFFSK